MPLYERPGSDVRFPTSDLQFTILDLDFTAGTKGRATVSLLESFVGVEEHFDEAHLDTVY